MAETPFVSPWADPPAAPAPPAPPAAPRAPSLIVNLLSTALLFAWLGWQMGWIWGLAGVVGVFVHEFGHVLVINALGFGPSRIRIIPFLGGAATMPRLPDTEFKGVLISLAGPAFGMIAALPFFAAAWATHDPQWLGGAFFVGALSLINLIPSPPLDGAKALGPPLARIHPLLERFALAAVGAAAVVWMFSRGSLIAPIFIGLGTFALLRSSRLRPAARRLSWGEWAASLGLYVAVTGLCAAGAVLALPGVRLIGPLQFLGLSGGHS